jgi:hypothetical protein
MESRVTVLDRRGGKRNWPSWVKCGGRSARVKGTSGVQRVQPRAIHLRSRIGRGNGVHSETGPRVLIMGH